MPKIYQRYAIYMPRVNSIQLPQAKIYQRYARSNSEATYSRQLPKVKICQRYAKYMPKICHRKLPKADNKLPKIWYKGVCEIYTKNMPKICKRYAKDMPKIC